MLEKKKKNLSYSIEQINQSNKWLFPYGIILGGNFKEWLHTLLPFLDKNFFKSQWVKSLSLEKLMTSVAIGKTSSGLLSRALLPMQGDVENCDSWLYVELLSSSKQKNYMCCQTLHGRCSSRILFVIGVFTWRSNSTISSNSGPLRFPNGAHKFKLFTCFSNTYLTDVRKWLALFLLKKLA